MRRLPETHSIIGWLDGLDQALSSLHVFAHNVSSLKTWYLTDENKPLEVSFLYSFSSRIEKNEIYWTDKCLRLQHTRSDWRTKKKQHENKPISRLLCSKYGHFLFIFIFLGFFWIFFSIFEIKKKRECLHTSRWPINKNREKNLVIHEREVPALFYVWDKCSRTRENENPNEKQLALTTEVFQFY